MGTNTPWWGSHYEYRYPVKCEVLYGFCGLWNEWIQRFVNNWKRYTVKCARHLWWWESLYNSSKEEQMFKICSTVDNHQTSCHLTTCNSSAFYWKKIAAWKFWNSVFICKLQVVVEAPYTELFTMFSASGNFRADRCHTSYQISHEELNGGHFIVFVSLWMRCLANQVDNHWRWDLHPLLHTQEQATKYGLGWFSEPALEKAKMTRSTGKIMGLYSGTGRGFYPSNTILRVSIPLKLPMSRHWKHYKLLFATRAWKYAIRKWSFHMTCRATYSSQNQRPTCTVCLGNFWTPSLFPEFGTAWFLSLPSAKEITR